MEYSEFENAILHYQELYDKGLKKQANKYIAAFAQELKTIKDEEQDEIFYKFIEAFCDTKEYSFLQKRGNGEIPFAIKQSIKPWLRMRCIQEKMPELRWFYELFRHDKEGFLNADEYLEKAYNSNNCDHKTVQLLFISHLETLDWGAHHFPEGCIITDEARDYTFEECNKIIATKEVDKELIKKLRYYEILYKCYAQYCDDGRKKDFDDYCKDAEIEHWNAITVYYY